MATPKNCWQRPPKLATNTLSENSLPTHAHALPAAWVTNHHLFNFSSCTIFYLDLWHMNQIQPIFSSCSLPIRVLQPRRTSTIPPTNSYYISPLKCYVYHIPPRSLKKLGIQSVHCNACSLILFHWLVCLTAVVASLSVFTTSIFPSTSVVTCRTKSLGSTFT